ncbi:MAG: bifunctional adenosylcobinamide kinase/adenosylcobinamide-phosphate guanylyltransferase [Lachnospiraceae bacterium]
MMTVITGGSGSGKSAYAEAQAVRMPQNNRYYIATMQVMDAESVYRIERHKAMRAGKGFATIECPQALEELVLPQHQGTALLECMSNLVANEMFMPNAEPQGTVERVLRGVKRLREQTQELLIVTNEVFSSGEYYEGDMKDYLTNLGLINQKIAQMADRVVEVVYGIPVILKEKNDACNIK